MTEKDMWRTLYHNAGAYAHMTRVENAASFGMPDVNVAYDNEEFWLELKVASSSRIKIRQTQLAWIIKRNQFKQNIFFLIYDVGAYCVCNAHTQEMKEALLSCSNTLYLDIRKISQVGMVVPPYKWAELFEHICWEIQERKRVN